MTDRERFLATLAKNEDDNEVRLAYADWLDEHGEYDEANRMRAWKASKDWFVRMIKKHGHDGDYDYPPKDGGVQYLYHHLLQKAVDVIKELEEKPSWRNADDRPYINFGNREQLQDAMQDAKENFWRHVGVLTGLVLPVSLMPKTYFGCSC